MYRNSLVLVVSIILIAISAGQVRAQDRLAAELYGRGVHAFYSGNYQQAYEYLSQAIQQKTDDPRTFYFRAFTLERMGRPTEARSDMEQGARLEAEGTDRDYRVGKSLERIQGPDRLRLEDIRQEARFTVSNTKQEVQRARYQEFKQDESRVLLDPNRKVEPDTTVSPNFKPDATDPFAGDASQPATPSPNTPALPSPNTPPATPSPNANDPFANDPFGNQPTPTPATPSPNANDPFGNQPTPPATQTPEAGDPFGNTPPAGSAPKGGAAADTDPFGGDPFGNAQPNPAAGGNNNADPGSAKGGPFKSLMKALGKAIGGDEQPGAGAANAPPASNPFGANPFGANPFGNNPNPPANAPAGNGAGNDPFGGNNANDPFGGNNANDPFGGNKNAPPAGNNNDPFGGNNNPPAGNNNDPFGGAGNPPNGAAAPPAKNGGPAADPFGNDQNVNPFEDDPGQDNPAPGNNPANNNDPFGPPMNQGNDNADPFQ